MPFPKRKRFVYKNNQLNSVVCQLRYPPILRIDSEVPAIFQEAIRQEYPLYIEKTEFLPNAPSGVKAQFPQEAQIQVASTGSLKNHEFCTEDKSWRINLARTFLAVSTSKYNRWEEFSDRFTRAYEKLLHIYEPPFFTRIGLRYTDIFVRSKLGLADVKWADLLQPPFLGLISSDVGEEIRSFDSVYEVWLSDSESVVRIALSLAVDIATKEQCFVVDSDFFSAGKTPVDTHGQARGTLQFNLRLTPFGRLLIHPRVNPWNSALRVRLEGVSSRLEFLHVNASNLIQSIISPRLHDAMEPQEI